MNAPDILKEVGGWPGHEQLELVHALWDQIVDSGLSPVIDDELNDELERRWAEHQANPTKTYSLEEVLAYARRPK